MIDKRRRQINLNKDYRDCVKLKKIEGTYRYLHKCSVSEIVCVRNSYIHGLTNLDTILKS